VLNTYKTRDFTLLERLMSEARVLSDYLYKSVVTLPHSFGIFHDDYAISHSVLDPPQTLIAILFILALIASAFYFIRRAQVYSFAILWFFAGHILESTFIPLELYFEHRNYLPIVGILFALVFYSFKLYDMLASRTLRVSFAAAAVLYMGVLSSVTYTENILWGDVYKQAYVWSTENKDSIRAQMRLGNVLAATTHYEDAAKVYRDITRRFPKNIIAYVEWLALTCHNETITPPTNQEIILKLSNAKLEVGVIASLYSIVSLKEESECNAIPYGQLVQILETIADNPEFKAKKYYLYFLLGKLHAAERFLNPAMLNLDKAFSLNRTPQIPLLQTEWLVSAGLYEDAKIYLEKARQSAKRKPLLNLALKNQFQWWDEAIATLESRQSPPKL
jgi:tetratricopeptide (TPR) repeat protein